MTADGEQPHRFATLIGTVRFRVTALATLAATAVLVAVGIALLTVQHQHLIDNLDETLQQRAEDVAAIPTAGPAPTNLAGGDLEDTLAQVVTLDGRVLAASPNIVGAPSVAGPPPEGQVETLRTVNGLPVADEEFRLLSSRRQTPEGTVVVHVAGRLDDVRDSTDVLARSLMVAIPAVAVLLAALVWWLVGRTLRPVEAIRAEVAHVGGTDMHRRVPVPRGGDEIARLARTMNDMLDRLEDATRRQREFVADASHELRSPLTRMRSEIEVDLAHPGTADLAGTHRSILAETIGLQRLADDLLALARSDAGADTGRSEPVDLDDIVLRQARRLRADGHVTVDIAGVCAAQVQGDPDQLTRALRNVADNAARHAASAVALTLTEHDGFAVLTVADDGPGIPRDQHQRVFERFTRLDDARSAEDGGSGLGLAITRDIISRHGGTIAVDPDHHPGTRFNITIPTGRSPASRSENGEGSRRHPQ